MVLNLYHSQTNDGSIVYGSLRARQGKISQSRHAAEQRLQFKGSGHTVSVTWYHKRQQIASLRDTGKQRRWRGRSEERIDHLFAEIARKSTLNEVGSPSQ